MDPTGISAPNHIYSSPFLRRKVERELGLRLTTKTRLAGAVWVVDRGKWQGRAAGMLVTDDGGGRTVATAKKGKAIPVPMLKIACSMKIIPCSNSQGICP